MAIVSLIIVLISWVVISGINVCCDILYGREYKKIAEKADKLIKEVDRLMFRHKIARTPHVSAHGDFRCGTCRGLLVEEYAYCPYCGRMIAWDFPGHKCGDATPERTDH